MRQISNEKIIKFRNHLIEEEKASATVNKYISDVTRFAEWLEERRLEKNALLEYKSYLLERYAPSSVNLTISSLNSFFGFIDRQDLRVKIVKIQRQIFSASDKELTKSEYERLLRTARDKGNNRLYCIMQTICSTGIRISELKYITAESVERGSAEIACKGKRRTVFMPAGLCKILKHYIKEEKIKKGTVFVTKKGNPIDRSNIWADMKKLCREAGVSEKKVFPHNLRHLFARTYYSIQKDIVRLADILGHSSINTTRIYTMESGEVHRRQIQKLGLLLCYK